MHIEEGRYRVEGTEGSSSCGGMHIDSLLLSFVLQKMISHGIGYRLKSKVRPVEVCLSVCMYVRLSVCSHLCLKVYCVSVLLVSVSLALFELLSLWVCLISHLRFAQQISHDELT
jgi:hypothetical protein